MPYDDATQLAEMNCPMLVCTRNCRYVCKLLDLRQVEDVELTTDAL
jgi:predicted ArsR family transcriptional regulator